MSKCISDPEVIWCVWWKNNKIYWSRQGMKILELISKAWFLFTLMFYDVSVQKENLTFQQILMNWASVTLEVVHKSKQGSRLLFLLKFSETLLRLWFWLILSASSDLAEVLRMGIAFPQPQPDRETRWAMVLLLCAKEEIPWVHASVMAEVLLWPRFWHPCICLADQSNS
jgi:hypothetical protein